MWTDLNIIIGRLDSLFTYSLTYALLNYLYIFNCTPYFNKTLSDLNVISIEHVEMSAAVAF